MKKQFTALLVTAALSAQAIGVSASSFYDLNEFHAWAEPQIEEMTTLGIIKGYTDGSFRPDRAITKTEALVLTARAAGYIQDDYDDFLASASERYKDVLSEYSTPYTNEIAFLLYKGVLTYDDLSVYISPDRADSPLLRYEMAILLTKLMRAEDSLSSIDSSLDYSDTGDIPFAATAYVSYVTNASLMQGVYDPEYPDEVFFKPYSSVTRAQMAVLLHRVLDKFDIDISYVQVVGKNPAQSTITYRTSQGKTSFYTLTDSVRLVIDGYETRDLSHVYSGASVAFFYINNTLSDVEIVNTAENRFNGVESSEPVSSPTEPVEGIVTSITMGEDCTVTIDNSEYVISPAATIYVNHVASTIYDLRVGYEAQLTFSGGKAILIYATSPGESDANRVTAQGTVTKLNLTNRQVYIEVENTQTGIVNERVLYIETGASVFNAISGKSVDFLSLEVDDTITATGTVKDGIFYASKIIIK